MTEILTFNYLLLIRLVVAAICGGIVGWERGGTNHAAGLRTHILVCLGAASIMVVSQCIVEQYGIKGEIMRMGAQIVSGVGFLGAGSIIMDGNRIRGITTAAGLWTTACVGIIIGSGYYIIGIFVVLLMFIAMYGLRSVTSKLRQKSSLHYTVKLEIKNRECLKEAIHHMTNMDISIRSLKIVQDENSGTVEAILEITLPNNSSMDEIISEISSIAGILQFTSVS